MHSGARRAGRCARIARRALFATFLILELALPSGRARRLGEPGLSARDTAAARLSNRARIRGAGSLARRLLSKRGCAFRKARRAGHTGSRSGCRTPPRRSLIGPITPSGSPMQACGTPRQERTSSRARSRSIRAPPARSCWARWSSPKSSKFDGGSILVLELGSDGEERALERSGRGRVTFSASVGELPLRSW